MKIAFARFARAQFFPIICTFHSRFRPIKVVKWLFEVEWTK